MVHLALGTRVRTSPFFEATLRAGLTDVTVYNRMVLPVSYGDLDGEYRRLTEAVSLWDVGAERQVEITGPDADRLADRLVTRDLSGVEPGMARYAPMCDHEGRLLNDPVALRLDDRWWLSLADGDMLAWVRGVAAHDGLVVDVREPDVSPLAVQGPRAEDVVATVFGDEFRMLGRFRHRAVMLDGIPVVVCRSGWSGQGGFEIFLRDGSRGIELWDRIMEAGRPWDIGPGAPHPVERVESGLLSFGADTTPDSNPYEAGLDRYVDLDAVDDYIGRDALRRIASDGPRRRLVGLVLEGSRPTRATIERCRVVADGETVGTASTVVWSPKTEACIGVAQVAEKHAVPGTMLSVETVDGVRRATVTEF